MLRYKNRGYMIEVRIPKHKKFYALCMYHYDKESGKYALSMWLKHDDFDEMFKIDAQHIDTQLISGTKETIRENICKIVEQAARTDYFNKYIDRFKYTVRCFDIGNTYYENQRHAQ